MNIATQLQIKYGLVTTPSDLQVQRWHNQYLAFRANGTEPEEAGHAAAQAVFPDYGKMRYASQADTIDFLLAELKKK